MRDVDAWKEHIRRRVNFLYQCAAVQEVEIRQRGPGARHWRVVLYPGNNARWARGAFARALREEIADAREMQRLAGPDELTIASGGRQ